VVHAHVQRNPASHLAYEPGVFPALPAVQTALANMALCGDWIAAPWPIFYLERACVTGILAARQVAPALGLEAAQLPEPLPPFPAAFSIRLLRGLVRAARRTVPRERAAG
jgi:uncharacterized protein with NAD-binding domain and iron-sulfur cluster